MLLRPRQQVFVSKNVEALMEYGNTLGVAPTGAGKTLCFSAVIRELIKYNPDLKTCVIAHRDELTYQNLDKFKKVNPNISTSVIDSRSKSWDGQVTFAMVQTLSKEHNLKEMPPLDLIVVDEAHHITADSYISILNHAIDLNPEVKIFGVTATPSRGDRSSLGQVFNNCGDQITLGELVFSGNLVRPKTFVIDMGNTQEKLKALRTRSGGDYSETEVASILDSNPLNSEVIRHWREKAGDRKTVVFCSNSTHAKHVFRAYLDAGIKTGIVTCNSSYSEREAVLNDLKCDKIQVIINVAVLTEGWDYPPISCVVLLRQSSYKSTMLQMIGRGLRTVDPDIYPNVIKRDCIILDFGISSIIHGFPEQSICLNENEQGFRICPACRQRIAKGSDECPLCGSNFEIKYYDGNKTKGQEAKNVLENFKMAELNLLAHSNFSWTKLDKKSQIATGFSSWVYICKKDGVWVAVGGAKKDELESFIPTKIVYQGEKLEALAAGNDFLCCFEDEEAAKKTASWRTEKPTEKQLNYLPKKYKKVNDLTRGDASAIIAYSLRAKPKLEQLGVL
jgi:DNA repair protein RadD